MGQYIQHMLLDLLVNFEGLKGLKIMDNHGHWCISQKFTNVVSM